MATDGTRVNEPRGLMDISSRVATINADGVLALQQIAVDGEIGGTVKLIVSVDRSMNPRAARLELKSVFVEITLQMTTWLLNSDWGKALYNMELAKVNWETLGGNEADSEESSIEGEEGAAVAVPLGELPSRGRRWPATPRGTPNPKSLRDVLESSRSDGDGKRSQAAAFKKAEEVSAELLARLTSCGLEGFALAFGKARIHSSVLLSAYTVGEVEASFQRPIVLGAKFKFDAVQRRLVQKLGALGDVPAMSSIEDVMPAGAVAIDGEEEVEMAFDFDAVLRPPGTVVDEPSTATRTVTAPSPPISLALVGCEFATLLLGKATLSADDPIGSEREVKFVSGILQGFAVAAGSSVVASSTLSTLEEVIDSLDVLLGQLIGRGLLGRSQLMPALPGSRAAARHAQSLAMTVEEARSRPPSPPELVGHSSDGLSNLAKVIAASNCKPLSEKDEKVSEELAASRTRLQRVCDNPTSMEALAALAALTESKETPVNQLKHYKQVCAVHPAVSDLIASSHVRMPTGAGEFSALHPGAELIVKHTRIVRTGLKAALTAVTRKMVPAGANMSGAIDAALAGALHSAADGSVAHLASSKDAKLYLGMAAKPLSDKTANSRAELQVLGIKAIPLLARMLEELHPAATIGLTMTDVMALYGRGIAVRTVPETVEGVLVPLFRAYEEAFGRFQKSATQSAPVMAEVWELEQAAPTVMAFISLIGTAEASRGSSGGDGGETATALEKRLAALETKIKQRPAREPAPKAGETTPLKGTQVNQPPDPNSKRSREKAARMLKEAADGAAAGAPAAAPAAP